MNKTTTTTTTTQQAATHAEVVEWEDFEGGVIGYNADWDPVVEVDALQDHAQRVKWGETYRAGRAWSVTLPDGTIRRGHSANIRAAKASAVALLETFSALAPTR